MIGPGSDKNIFGCFPEYELEQQGYLSVTFSIIYNILKISKYVEICFPEFELEPQGYLSVIFLSPTSSLGKQGTKAQYWENKDDDADDNDGGDDVISNGGDVINNGDDDDNDGSKAQYQDNE